MGYKSTLRTFGTIARQAHRESVRKQKLLEKQRNQYHKMQELEQAAFEVEEHENYIERMTTLHKDCGDSYDWKRIVTKNPPKEPV